MRYNAQKMVHLVQAWLCGRNRIETRLVINRLLDLRVSVNLAVSNGSIRDGLSAQELYRAVFQIFEFVVRISEAKNFDIFARLRASLPQNTSECDFSFAARAAHWPWSDTAMTCSVDKGSICCWRCYVLQAIARLPEPPGNSWYDKDDIFQCWRFLSAWLSKSKLSDNLDFHAPLSGRGRWKSKCQKWQKTKALAYEKWRFHFLKYKSWTLCKLLPYFFWWNLKKFFKAFYLSFGWHFDVI